MIKTGMTDKEFQRWKHEWFLRVPKCKDFACCHELSHCAIIPLCGCGSIYLTYKNQECPLECLEVTCADCFNKYDCAKPSWSIKQITRASGLIEDICKHGVGHPNKAYLQSHPEQTKRQALGVHGCDGCCQEKKQ